MERTKECTKCGETKPFSAFSKHRLSKDGHAYQCKECNAKRAKEWRKTPSAIYTNINGRQRFYQTHQNPREKPVIISKDEFIDWYNKEPKFCAYCDVPEDRLLDFYDSYNKWSERLSVDAKDNSLGYMDGNIVLACRRCNSLKSDILTFDEMREFAQKYIKPKWMAQLESPRICPRPWGQHDRETTNSEESE